MIPTALYPIFLFALAYVPTVAGLPCETLEECTAKGVELIGRIKDARVGLTEKYKKWYEGREKHDALSDNDDTWKEITAIMNGLTLTIPPTLTKVTIEGDSDTAYENIYGEGLIVATSNYNIYDPVPEANRVNWDVIAFEQYHRSLELGLADLTYILRHTVTNTNTNKILNMLYEQAKMEGDIRKIETKWREWNLERHANGFHALLETPNGQGAGFLLVDYATTMGGKSITGIHGDSHAEIQQSLDDGCGIYQGRDIRF